jgi:large subunit ribosomal protein L35Ae
MEGIVLSYRRGSHTQNVNQVLIDFGLKDSKEALKLLEKKLIWKSPSGKEIVGIVLAVHGKKGVVRAKFTPNLPGQAVGTKVKVQ